MSITERLGLNGFKKKLLSYPAWKIIVVAVVSFIAHGSILFSKTVGIDTEATILGIDPYAEQGRQGIIWLRHLMQMSDFNLYLVTALTFFLLPVAAILIYTCLTVRDSESSAGFVLFCLFFVTSPYWACQLYFLGQSVPVLVSVILTPITAMLVDASVDSKPVGKILYLLAGSVLFQFVISTYQVNLIVYIAFVCAAFVLNHLHDGKGLKEHFIILLHHVLFVLAGLVIYRLITVMLYAISSYLTDQIAWTKVGIKGGLRNLFYVAKEVIKGDTFYNYLFVPLCIAAFVLTILNCLKAKEKARDCLFPILAEIVLFVTPFFFPILYGSDVTPRMRYVFPVAGAFALLICFKEFKLFFGAEDAGGVKKTVKTVLVVLFCVAFFADTMKNLNYTNFLYYTNDFRYEQEYLAARDIKRDLDGFFAETGLDPNERNYVVFMGRLEVNYNVMGRPKMATIGASTMNWDTDSMTRGRIYHFMDVAGYPIGVAPYYSEGAQKAYAYYYDEYFGAETDAMPCYPQKGYIKEVRNDELGLHYIVVKLGNDWRDLIDFH